VVVVVVVVVLVPDDVDDDDDDDVDDESPAAVDVEVSHDAAQTLLQQVIPVSQRPILTLSL